MVVFELGAPVRRKTIFETDAQQHACQCAGTVFQETASVGAGEGEAAWSNLMNRFNFNDGFFSSLEASDRNRWNADLAARTGIAFDRALLYGKAGVAAGRFNFFETDTNGGFLQGGTTLTGLLLGTGIEYAFAPNSSLKLEYDHVG